jgi:hypothetical protein
MPTYHEYVEAADIHLFGYQSFFDYRFEADHNDPKAPHPDQRTTNHKADTMPLERVDGYQKIHTNMNPHHGWNQKAYELLLLPLMKQLKL